MGTWDTGPYDNDTAADFACTLDEADPQERPDLVRAALARAAGATGPLGAPAGDEAVAAAALVAAHCPGGDPVDPVHGPEEPLPDLAGLRTLALQALDRVVAEPSEVAELWAGPDGAPWRAAVHRLQEVLQPRPPGTQLRPH